MVQINGTYKFVSQDNYLEYLKSIGLPDDIAQKAVNSKETLVLSLNGDILTVSPDGKPSVALPLNQEIEHISPTGQPVKTTTTINGNIITFKTNLGQVTENRVFEITDSSLTTTLTNSNGGKAVQKYKRV